MASRELEVRKFLKPIIRKGASLKISRSMNNNELYLYVYEESRLGVSGSDSFFVSINPKYDCQYHEKWLKRGSSYKLYQAYLSIHLRATGEEPAGEFLCLHIDPMEVADTPTGVVKRAPHFHVKASREPLPHVHFALDLVGQREMLKSLENVTARMTAALKLIRCELLDRDLPSEDRLPRF